MFFKIFSGGTTVPAGARNQAFLFQDKWDDWGKYRTQFALNVVDESGETHYIGEVKIGQKGLLPAREVSENHRAPSLPREFDSLDENFFSLGQGEDYYENLNKLSTELCQRVLHGLQDCAADLRIFDANYNETVMQESLLRSVQASSVRGRLSRLSRGDARLTKFDFSYALPSIAEVPSATLGFAVVPESNPPTNVHALIGRNGVGKTRCMRSLALALLGRQAPVDESYGAIEMGGNDFDEKWSFAGVIFVSFSAFDDFRLQPQSTDSISSNQIGLRYIASGIDNESVKTFDALGSEFADSLQRCRAGVKANRWRAAVNTLEEDDLFGEANVSALLDLPFGSEWIDATKKLFTRLSSGHAIVLLTVTRLVELVDERTLVLLDEPEGHLHPPLLASFIRCLSDLLVKRNGVAIIATHSPVVLQEVPQSCAWKLRRSRNYSVAERPSVETFGENLGILTREVFGLQVTQSGFHRLIRLAVAEGLDYSGVLEKFNSQLGDEAKAIVQALIAERDQDI